MEILKCKMCGGELDFIEGTNTAKCIYCGSLQTVPKSDSEKKIAAFARANQLRTACEFDKAAGIYETIVIDYPEEAEAYWGLVLCKYGIEYVEDPNTGRRIPTCHRSSVDLVLEDSDYKRAINYADPLAKRLYQDEAKQIDRVCEAIISVSNKEKPYDIFICYKESDEDGQRTEDSVLAHEIYSALTDKHYRVFFSRITLEGKLGIEYEPYIYAALSSAKVMLVVGTNEAHYNAVWVKNEWSRYLKMMEKDKDKHLIPCYKNIDVNELPKEFVRYQGQDMGKIGAEQDLLHGIEKIIPNSKQNVGKTDDSDLMHQTNSDRSRRSKKSRFVDQIDNDVRAAETFIKLCDYDSARNIFEMLTRKCPYDYRGWWGLIRLETDDFTDEDLTKQSLQEVDLLFDKACTVVNVDEKSKISAKYNQYREFTVNRLNAIADDAESQIKYYSKELARLTTEHQKKKSSLEESIAALKKREQNSTPPSEWLFGTCCIILLIIGVLIVGDLGLFYTILGVAIYAFIAYVISNILGFVIDIPHKRRLEQLKDEIAYYEVALADTVKKYNNAANQHNNKIQTLEQIVNNNRI